MISALDAYTLREASKKAPPLDTFKTLFVNFRQKKSFLRPKTHILGVWDSQTSPPYLGQSPKKYHFLFMGDSLAWMSYFTIGTYVKW